MSRERLRTAITAVFILAGFAATWNGAERLRFLDRQLAARAREDAALELRAQTLAELRRGYDTLTTTARPEDRLAELARRHLEGAPHDLALRERRDEGGDWFTARYDLRIERIDAAAAARFLAACENARPPVRLIDIQISSAPAAPGQLALQLALAELAPKNASSTQ